MTSLESKQLPESSRLEDFNAKYPAILLGQMGVDKKSRKRRLGKLLCNYCIGFAENISEHIACRYIILQTNQANIDFYKKSGFQQSVKSNPEGKFWMYRRLSVEIEHVVSDTVGITESVYSKVTPEDNDKKKIND